MNVLLLKGFNNYFNRIVKRYTSLADYRNNSSAYLDLDDINFNPNDGITAELVLGEGNLTNWEHTGITTIGTVFGVPDYLIVYANVGSNIVAIRSRWFILEAKRTRSGQYHITLKRDVIADNYNELNQATVFVEKAMLDRSNPLIFNKEGMQLNQIKQEEIALKDETGCGWVVGYIPQNAFEDGSGNPQEKTITKNVFLDATNADITVTNLSDWYYYKYCENNANAVIGLQNMEAITRIKFIARPSYGATRAGVSVITDNIISTEWGQYSPASTYSSITVGMQVAQGNILFTSGLTYNSTYRASLETYLIANTDLVSLSSAEYNDILALNGKLLYISTSNTYYKVSVRNLSNTHDLPGTNALATYIDNQLISIPGETSISGDLRAADVSFTFNTSEIILELEQVYMQCSVKINENNVLSRCHLIDSPYDMFCIPYSDELQLKYGNTTFTCNKSAAIAIAIGVSEQLGSGSIYDLQLLPYCPNRSLATSLVNGVVTIDDLKYDLILDSNNNAISAVIWCDKSNFQFEINQTLTSSQIEAMDSLNLKLENECKLYRLCAGNHSAMFEFSLAKSNGISGFLVDCTYKPFNPYIHVIPKLKGLYGENFTNIDDARGLIYGGDLSLPQITSAWADYQLQNKNYQLMFDRQIANIDVNNGIAQEKQNFQNVLGVLGGGVGGAAAGAKAGPYGAIAGAVVGTATAGIGAALQSDWLTRQQEENRSFTIDMYKYNLGNIQALPYALAKTSALTANTRIWPFVEIYSCTDEEREALKNNILFTGMTVMKIDILGNYITGEQKFFKGKLIRATSAIVDDSHVVDEIYNELNKGVFM